MNILEFIPWIILEYSWIIHGQESRVCIKNDNQLVD